MKIGAVFPQTEFGNDPKALRQYAQSIEEWGFDYLVAYDHVLGANPDRPGGWSGPYTYKNSFHEPFVLFGYLAAVTRKIELLTGIIILPQRQTALVAKQAAEVDVLSGGRLSLGVAIGWNPVEYQSLAEDFHNRGRRIEEQIEVMRLLWTQELVTYKGRWHEIPDAGLNPLPVQRPIPVWLGGGHSEVVLRRIARLSDGWVGNGRPGSELAATLERLRGYIQEAGRSIEDVGLAFSVKLGSEGPAEWLETAAGYRELGATRVAANTMGLGFTDPQQHLARLQEFKEAMDAGGR
ncbi:MAG: LLM class F420-dependent oxidoreductase [Thermaerobacterales bacterium]